jgi:hypothetical protein
MTLQQNLMSIAPFPYQDVNKVPAGLSHARQGHDALSSIKQERLRSLLYRWWSALLLPKRERNK